MLNDNRNERRLKYFVLSKLKLSIENISNNNLYENNDHIISYYAITQQPLKLKIKRPRALFQFS